MKSICCPFPWAALLLAACCAASSFAAAPVVRFELNELMRVYDFPEDEVSFSLRLEKGQARSGHLRLVESGNDQPLPYALTEVKQEDGWLVEATVTLRTSLDRGQSRAYELHDDPGYVPHFEQTVAFLDHSDGTATIRGNRQSVRVPHNVARPDASHAPVMALSRDGGQTWAGEGRLENCRIDAVEGRIVAHTPLGLTYRIDYQLDRGRRYVVDITVRHNEPFVLIDESYHGFRSEQEAYLAFNLDDGIAPEKIGFIGRTQAFTSDYPAAGRRGKAIGLYSVDARGDVGSMAFWGQADHALLACVRRKSEWVTERTLFYASTGSEQMIGVVHDDQGRRLRTRMEGHQRHWALGLVANENVGGTTAVRMYQKLTDLALDVYANLGFDYDESPDLKRPIELPLDRWDRDPAPVMSYQEYEPILVYPFQQLTGLFYDSAGILRLAWGESAIPRKYAIYARNRADWTEEQRARSRAILLWTAHMSAQDTHMPHKSMMGGHANFIAGTKIALPLAAASFPSHPDAPQWKQTYLEFVDTWVKTYIRDVDPEYNLRGGRFYENIANYLPAALKSIVNGSRALEQYDGTNLFSHPKLQEMMAWFMNSLMPYHGYNRANYTVPPVGAHAFVRPYVPTGRYHRTVLAAAESLRAVNPELGDQLLWMLTRGTPEKKGRKPELRSALYRDFGAVLRYDFGGPSEAYVYVQQILGRNYRWTWENNGVVYYAAKGQTWAWNTPEVNVGESRTPSEVSMFEVGGRGLEGAGRRMTEPLYDLGPLQYYVAGGDGAYRGRHLIMVRDDYLVLYDEVQDRATGTFHWANATAGLTTEYFADTELRDRRYTFVDDGEMFAWRARPLQFSEEPPMPGLPSEGWSARWSGQFVTATRGGQARDGTQELDFTHIGEEGDVRVWIDGEKIIDGLGKGTFESEKGRVHEIRIEYVHRKGPWALRMLYNGDTVRGKYHLRTQEPMPQIEAVRKGPGDQLHVVIPATHPLTTQARPYGVQVGDDEHVFISVERVEHREGPVAFRGTAGYARPNEVALFRGDRVAHGSLALEIEGDFAASARHEGRAVRGHITGQTGGTLRLTLPAEINLDGLTVSVAGRTVPHQRNGRVIEFAIAKGAADPSLEYVVSSP
jgi:hypothetical protein